MGTVGLLILAVAMPTAAGYLVVAARRLNAAMSRRRAPRTPQPSLAAIGDDLRRLHELYERSENAPSSVPAKHQRFVATRAAYLDALTTACQHLDVVAPTGRPVPRTEIYRVEADLRRRGVDVRSPG